MFQNRRGGSVECIFSYCDIKTYHTKIPFYNLFNANVSPIGRLTFKLAMLAATNFAVAVAAIQL